MDGIKNTAKGCLFLTPLQDSHLPCDVYKRVLAT